MYVHMYTHTRARKIRSHTVEMSSTSHCYFRRCDPRFELYDLITTYINRLSCQVGLVVKAVDEAIMPPLSPYLRPIVLVFEAEKVASPDWLLSMEILPPLCRGDAAKFRT